MNLVVPSPCETQPYNNQSYSFLLSTFVVGVLVTVLKSLNFLSSLEFSPYLEGKLSDWQFETKAKSKRRNNLD